MKEEKFNNKIEHIKRIEKIFGSVTNFYKWLGYELPSQSATSYKGTQTVDKAFVKLLDIYEHSSEIKGILDSVFKIK